jgi:adenine-specific DNA-methyltransferase
MNKIEANDPTAQSADIVAENLSQLRSLFPEAFAEGKVQFNTLRQLLGATLDDSDEKYGLNWHGKRRARQIALTPSTGTLLPMPDESVDWATTQNVMIEGDNLEVLKLLQKSYAGKVKMIYIDPPYNTGHDFVYPDNFRDSIGNYLELTGQVEGGAKISTNTDTSGRFHTDWLNMMYPRLRLARSLLRSDGLIYISIDDGEVAGLRLMLSEIFGEENFLANIVWQKKYSPQNDERYFSDSHEHLLVYAKSKESFEIGLLPRTDEANARYKNPDHDPRGAWKSSDLTRQEYRARDDYEIVSPKTGKGFRPPKGNSWGRPQDVVEGLIKDNRIWFGPDGNAVPSLKRFLSEVKQGITPQTIWYREEVGDTQEGKKTIKELFGDVSVFETAKPHRLIQRAMLTGAVNSNDIVLDFFAGSGTTGHAVMMQNLQDSGSRRYILVQLPEPMDRDDLPTISALVRERLRRVAAKLKAENPMFLGDTGFRAFKLEKSNIREWNPDAQNLAQSLLDHHEHILDGRTEADIVYELLLKLGLDLCIPIESRTVAGKTVGAVGGGVLMLCLAEKISAKEVETVAAGIVAWHKELAPAGDSTVVFRDSAFADDVAKTNMTAILAQNGLDNVRSL